MLLLESALSVEQPVTPLPSKSIARTTLSSLAKVDVLVINSYSGTSFFETETGTFFSMTTSPCVTNTLIEVSPSATAVTNPSLLTVATEVLLDS